MIVKTLRHHLEEENFHPNLEKYSRQMLTVSSKLPISFLGLSPSLYYF